MPTENCNVNEFAQSIFYILSSLQGKFGILRDKTFPISLNKCSYHSSLFLTETV